MQDVPSTRRSHRDRTYIINRIKVAVDERLHPRDPWLTRSAITMLDGLLRPDDVGVEFGSGRSTVWFAERLAHLTSVESDAHWYANVRTLLARKGLGAKVDYRLCPDSDDYAAQCAGFADASISFCLIDGKARDRCAMQMLPKLKSGAVLVIDNVNRYLPNDKTVSPGSRRLSEGGATQLWNEFLAAVKDWRCCWTSNGVSDTCIWIHP